VQLHQKELHASPWQWLAARAHRSSLGVPQGDNPAVGQGGRQPLVVVVVVAMVVAMVVEELAGRTRRSGVRAAAVLSEHERSISPSFPHGVSPLPGTGTRPFVLCFVCSSRWNRWSAIE
jgi:hypothetical protein